MPFVGRRPELELLERHYESSSAALIPVYGRRRVGKSRLIERFVAGKPCVSFLGKRTVAELQLQEFAQTAAKAMRNEALLHAKFDDWQTALSTVTRLWKGPRKLVLVMDELQWTAEASPELPSVLQNLWDREWKLRPDLMIVLCGSHIGFMEREILGQKSPLFGRRSDQIRLGPLPFPEAVELLKHYGEADQAGVYFMVGGIPAYLERFQPARPLSDAIAEEFCSELKFFALEPQFLLREELREPSRYFTVLTVLAKSRLRHRELARRSHIDSTVLPAYLETLLALGYVRKIYPVLPGKPKAVQVQYEIADPMLRFWFRFIFPNLQLCTPGQEKELFHQVIRPQLDAYFGSRFEQLCQESLLASYRRQRVLWQDIGSYWDPAMQIDVVGVRRDKWIDFGECKWSRHEGVSRLVELLKTKCDMYPGLKGHSAGLHIYLKHASKADLPRGVRVHTLKDMFA